jgi:hypothetical protein
LQYKASHFIRFGRPALATWLVGMVLLLDAMAACPDLHELIHKDAGEADHHCAVTVFAQGKVDSVACDVPVVAPTVWFETARTINFFAFSTAIEDLPHGRAPPAAVSSQA